MNNNTSHQFSKIIAGILVMVVGVIILFKQMGMIIPHWILSWKMLLIAIGIVTLIRHRFQNTGGYIMVFIGSSFLLNELIPDFFNPRYIWPIAIMIVGAVMIAKALGMNPKKKSKFKDEINLDDLDSDNHVRANAFFGGITKNVMSKNFKSANLSSVFGGVEVNLMQADFTNQAVIETTSVFGGTTLIIPSDWKVQTDVTCILGGVDDKRIILPELIDESKTLYIKGSCVFGGLEIHSNETYA